MAASAADAPAPEFACAVCLEEYPEEAAAQLPCCVIPTTATTRFCRRCIEIICESAPGGVGRCPNCRSYLRVTEAGQLETAEQMDTCTLCQQVRVIVESRGRLKLCDACLLGANHALRYECEQCRRFQRIPHPMWRYQRTPTEFGDNTWACHVRCNTQTRWRIAPQDAALVPVADTPESWGLREQWLAAVREQRLRERQGGAPPPPRAQVEGGGDLTTLLACGGLLLAWGFSSERLALGIFLICVVLFFAVRGFRGQA